MSTLLDGAERLGMQLSSAQLAQLDQLEAALLEWNKRINLTRIVQHKEVQSKHFLDSLTAALPVLERLKAGEPLRVVDVGSGAGFPGFPLKVAFPAIRLTLVESTGKKAQFLRHAVDVLGLADVLVVAERAETAAAKPEHRDSYDVAVARALGSLPVVVETCAPFLAQGGLLVALRKGDLDAELLDAVPAFKALKMWARSPIPVSLPGLEDGRGLVVAEKFAATPKRFPRRPGMAKKEPLARE